VAGKRGRPKSEGPSPIDIHVGNRIRVRRTLLDMSQQGLARALNLTLSAGAEIRARHQPGLGRQALYGRPGLGVPVADFFDGVGGRAAGGAGAIAPRRRRLRSSRPPAFGTADLLNQPETLKLVRAFYRIGDPELRGQVLDLFRACGNAS